MKTAILWMSLVANATLVAFLMLLSDAPSVPVVPLPAEESSEQQPATIAAESGGSLDAMRLRRMLLASGLSEQQIKPLLVAYLDAQISRSLAKPGANYWQASAEPVAKPRLELELEKRREEVRGLLVSIYGAGAANDLALAGFFRPLQDRVPFLSSEQQIALHHLRLQRQVERARNPSRGEDWLAPSVVAAENSMMRSKISSTNPRCLSTCSASRLLQQSCVRAESSSRNRSSARYSAVFMIFAQIRAQRSLSTIGASSGMLLVRIGQLSSGRRPIPVFQRSVMLATSTTFKRVRSSLLIKSFWTRRTS